MSLSDCEKCWETPCICGYNYRNWTTESKVELIRAVLGKCSHTQFQDICKEIFELEVDEYGDIKIHYKE